MASQCTNTLQRAVNYAQGFVQGRVIAGVGDVTNEPALSIGDWVRQFILAPPFAWSWNRAKTSLSISTGGGQDYPDALSAFGYLEEGSLSASGVNQELEVRLILGQDATQSQPTHVGTLLDDDNGNITFRVFPTPDQSYTVNLLYQQSPALFVNLSSLWTPIPDRLSYLYNTGFLAKVFELASDDRFGPTLQLFYQMVISASESLTDTQKNLFLSQTVITEREIRAVGGEGGKAPR